MVSKVLQYTQTHRDSFTYYKDIHPSVYSIHLSLCIYEYNANNKIFFINSVFQYLGMTSLSVECRMDAFNTVSNLDTVRILLEHGADVNTKDKDGKLHTSIIVNIIPINAL